jgi:uncharacterized protein (TIGR00251 family)
VIIQVKVIPGSRQNLLEKKEDGSYRVHIRAQPDKGKANDALIDFLAESLGVPKRCLRIVSGLTSRNKRIEIMAS